jgi:myo-inositol-1(or 4)-monophosphatase
MLEFISALAREAGAQIAAERAAGLTTSFKAHEELVTTADVNADRLICDAIRSRFPGHAILAEESAPDAANTRFAGPLWIIDPIDGTVNYAHGHPQVAVSIAYIENDDIHTGVVYNPFSDELFAAVRGQGAWLNGQVIRVGSKTELSRALVATGFPYKKGDMTPLVRRLAHVLNHCADIRRLGSAALDICWVAMGRLDGYYENLSLWDFAAAQLIAREAGAVYGHFREPPPEVNPVFHCNDILVANAALFPQLKAVLLAADC